MNLTLAAFEAAARFLREDARPLERALFAVQFESAPPSVALDALAAFQNTDGGFGHGLEADIRLADSSVIATTIAFQRLRELGAPATHPLVENGCRYLRETFDAASLNWPDVPASLDEAPHAPWWKVRDDLTTRRFNPRAEIAGYLNEYPSHFPAKMRETVTSSVFAALATHEGDMEMHDLLCLLRFYETPGLPPSIATAMAGPIERFVHATVEHDPAQWRGYGLQPLAVVTSPLSPFHASLADEVAQNLDFLIETQSESGAWEPTWSWGEDGDPAWPDARRDWSGVLTLDALVKLRAFGSLG